jgi:sulfide:quinone oxidoreductase
LSAGHWRRNGRLDNIEIEFYNAGGVLFGVKEYVPALMEYVELYRADLQFNSNLVAVDGPGKTA